MIVFNTVSFYSQGIFKESKSEFLSFIFPCKMQAEADKILNEYKKKYNNARHICWAICLIENNFSNFSDNGEPAGTAGSSLLNCIKSLSLYNIFVIVVRYFGGIKLGVKNLKESYRLAFIDALGKNKIVQKKIKNTTEIKISSHIAYKILNFLKKQKINFFIEECGEETKIKFEFDDDQRVFLESFFNTENIKVI